MKEYTYYLLDWDGNLAKTLDIWLRAYRIVLEKRGLFLSDVEIGATFGAIDTHMTSVGIADTDVAMDELYIIGKRELPDVELYPDALRVLSALRAHGKKIALITTSPHENVQLVLDKHNIAQYFDTIVAGDDVQNHKPDPEPLEMALNKLGGTKAEAVMIGDSDKDLGAAQNFGIDSILFYPPDHRKFYDLSALKTFDPTYVVEDFTMILGPFSNRPKPFDTFNIEKMAGEYKDFDTVDPDYPLKGVTYPVSYGDIEGYLGEDGVNLDVFMGTGGAYSGFIKVYRSELTDGEHKFYVNVTETEEASILSEFKPVLLAHKRFNSMEELLVALESFKKMTG